MDKLLFDAVVDFISKHYPGYDQASAAEEIGYAGDRNQRLATLRTNWRRRGLPEPAIERWKAANPLVSDAIAAYELGDVEIRCGHLNRITIGNARSAIEHIADCPACLAEIGRRKRG